MYMPKIWQKMKKNLGQLALNPFLHGTSKARNPRKHAQRARKLEKVQAKNS